MTTIELNPKLGAPFTAKSGQANPDDVLRQIMEEKPGMSEAETWVAFKEEILRDDDMVLACLRWYHIWARRRLENLNGDHRSKERGKSKKARAASGKASAKAATEKIKQIIILDFVMPNNKPLRDCTFGYVGKQGRMFSKIAGAGKPNQIVGEVLSNKQAKELIAA